MIVSHRHQYVFLKPRKVAGTSVEVALRKHCGPEDVVTPLASFNRKWDEDAYDSGGRNNEGYRRHGTLAEARRRLGREVWERYFKFSIVRNPWDLVVSQYHWATRTPTHQRTLGESLIRLVRRPRKARRNLLVLAATLGRRFFSLETVSFEFFATYLLRYYPPNDRYYFDRSGAVALDYVIRYEELDAGYRAVCDRIGVPAEDLPSLKSKLRPGGRHYTSYYDDRTRESVARAYRRQIACFGYRFEEA